MKERLLQEARELFDNGVPIILCDAKTKHGIGRLSTSNTVDDRDYLEELCEDNPDAILKVVTDDERRLVAIGVGIGSYAQGGEGSFKDLTNKYGVPDTLSYHLPNGESYYLFKLGEEKIRPQIGSGAMYLNGLDDFAVYPSLIDGEPITKFGTAANIMNLADWLAGTGESSQPDPEQSEDSVPDVSPVVEQDQLSSVSDVADVPVSAKSEITISTSQSGDLNQEISGWKDAGLHPDEILSRSLEWNRSQPVPMETSALIAIVESQPDSSNPDSEPLPAGSDILSRVASTIIPFHDEKNEPYFFFEGESFKAPSNMVAARLRHLYMLEAGSLPSKKDVNSILDILESRARFDGETINLKNRVAGKGDTFHFDMRDKRYLKISSEKWEIIPADFPLFMRFNHMQPQVTPVAGGSPWNVFNFLTVDKEDRLLIMVYLISLFIPRIAHPVLALFGEQGSAKSFFSTVINKLVDPTLTERIIQPKNERDLIQTVRQKYLTVLDNLSKIDNRVSDIFCQVCTGGSISMRKLFTDDGENIAQFRHAVILTSISLAIVNADLMDRSIILKLKRIKPEDRKPEQDLWDAFEDERPGILGGIFDTIVKAMAIYPTLTIDKLPRLPRLADFAKWGYAIAEALGASGAQFIDDYSQNIKRQNESVVEKNVLCQSIIRLMADKSTYLKSVGDIHKTLKAIAGEDSKDATFPKLPHHVRGHLDLLKSTLAEQGITYEFFDRQSKGVNILLSKTATSATSLGNPSLGAPIASLRSETNVSDVPDEAEAEIPTFEVDEIPEVVNG